MPTQTLLQPRKSPTQARSTASVEALREATVQVLVAVGPQRLTTARVARRAGVSIGTLYQYFPNKAALLHHALKHHLDNILAIEEAVCLAQAGRPLEHMVAASLTAFLDAKLHNLALGAAFYAISADIDGVRISQSNSARFNAALATMLASAPQPLAKDPALIASLLQGAMAGVSRRILEASLTPPEIQSLRDELIASMCAYVLACTHPAT